MNAAELSLDCLNFFSQDTIDCIVTIIRLLQEFYSQAEASSNQTAKQWFWFASVLPAFHARTNPFELSDRKVNIWKLVPKKPTVIPPNNHRPLSKIVQTRAFPWLFKS